MEEVLTSTEEKGHKKKHHHSKSKKNETDKARPANASNLLLDIEERHMLRNRQRLNHKLH
jgi:hypothetical protein